MTILKKSPQKCNIFAIMTDAPRGYRPVTYILIKLFHNISIAASMPLS